MFKKYSSFIEWLALVGGLLVFAMSALTSYDIAGREIFHKGLQGCYELVEYLMVFVVFLPLAYLESIKGNIRVEVLYSKFPETAQHIINAVCLILALAAFLAILYTSSIYAWESWVARETMYGIKGGPLYVWKFGVPFGVFFMCIQLVIGLVKEMKQLISGRE